MGQKIGFISFIPDGGHVLPLIRIAAAFMAHGYEVICYFPEESLKYADSFNVPAKSLGKVTAGVDKETFIQLSKRSIFYNGFSNFAVLEKGYMQPIKAAIADKIEEIKQIIIAGDLFFIIADSNAFNILYQSLAVSANIPLVIHISEGNCRHLQRPYVFNFGISKRASLIQTIIEKIGFCYGWVYIRMIVLRFGVIYHDFTMFYMKPFQGIDPGKVSLFHITTGMAFIEKERINGIRKPEDNLALFPPVSGWRTARLSPGLQKWFDEAKKPVVYISFGTMVKGDKRLFTKIINGLKDLEVNILWSAPHDQKLLLEKIGILPDMRVEEFVPQPEVLAIEQVRCFITHAGAGSVQESLLSGKPLLCIPFLFDQPYNSSVVVSLGVGIRLWRNRISSGSVKRAVKQLLYHRAYRDAAQDIKKHLREIDGGEAIIRYFRKIGILPEKADDRSEKDFTSSRTI